MTEKNNEYKLELDLFYEYIEWEDNELSTVKRYISLSCSHGFAMNWNNFHAIYLMHSGR